MKRIIIISLAFFLSLLLASNTFGQDKKNKFFHVIVRAAYNIGGTAPLGVPATIRSIDSFKPTPSVMGGIDFQLTPGRLGILAGVHYENKAMDTKVTTKGYRMELVKGDSRMEGLFTGHVKQEVTQWMLTIPVMLTCRLGNRVTWKVGPYISILTDKDFSGIASDGYLRQGDPTGPRINMGDKEGEWATYDFSDEMEDRQYGVAMGFDWRLSQHVGIMTDINWGLTGVFDSDFKTVEQTLYPIYANIGLFLTF
jgi:hypothetical protein